MTRRIAKPHSLPPPRRASAFARSLGLALLLIHPGAGAGVVAPAAGQPAGTLSGRIVYTSGGHGWVLDASWGLQRGITHEMNEDYGNLDQMAMFAYYCFNAGATVVPIRPVGHQTNEVVLDNATGGVSFTGAWTLVTSEPVYYGAAGSGYRQAAASAIETATATYTPNIPVTGFYPVYGWAPHGADRTNQLYRVVHTGGESQVRVPHHMVGNGWVYLGTYYFTAGSNAAQGAVIVSNLQPGALPGSVVIADAIRFGNGMSSSGSGYPREEEGARHWVQNSLGQGQSSSIYLSPGDTAAVEDRKARAKMVREMNREQSGATTKRLYISFHSNAFNGAARGTVGLYHNTNPTSRQSLLASLMGREVTDDMVSLNSKLEFPWHDRGSGTLLSGAYPEIDNTFFSGEMDATVIEVAFHDNASDAALMRSAQVRNWVARACYHSVARYMNLYDGAPLVYLPEPPTNVRAVGAGDNVAVSWSAPVPSGGSGSATGYVVYRSADGYGFGNPVVVSGAATTSVTLTNLAADTAWYFRVAAFNTGGESFPSETVGWRRSANPALRKILFVNAFDRFDRTTNLRQTPTVKNYAPPGNTGTMERVLPRSVNSFDYVVQHGRALAALGRPFDSCHRTAVVNGQVNLTNYPVVIWAAGGQVTNSFSSTAQALVANYLAVGGHFFVSGSDIARELDRSVGPSASDRAFLNNQLRADLGADANTNAMSYTFTPAAGSIFSGNGGGTFDNGNQGVYWVKSPDKLTPIGPGATAAMNYTGGLGGAAAVQYDGSGGGGRVVYWGFPFETVVSAAARQEYLDDILRFFSLPARVESITLLPDRRPQLVLSGEPGLTYAVEASSDMAGWVTVTNLLNTAGTVEFIDSPVTNHQQRFYRSRLAP